MQRVVEVAALKEVLGEPVEQVLGVAAEWLL
jgi:hypothetical protein